MVKYINIICYLYRNIFLLFIYYIDNFNSTPNPAAFRGKEENGDRNRGKERKARADWRKKREKGERFI